MASIPNENNPYLSDYFKNSSESENISNIENDIDESGEIANFDFSPFFFANHAFQDDEITEDDGDLTYTKLDNEKKAEDAIDKDKIIMIELEITALKFK